MLETSLIVISPCFSFSSLVRASISCFPLSVEADALRYYERSCLWYFYPIQRQKKHALLQDILYSVNFQLSLYFCIYLDLC